MTTVQITIRESTLPALLAFKRKPDESIADVIERIAERCAQNGSKSPEKTSVKQNDNSQYKYELVFLGDLIAADALGDLYGKLVDALNEVAPDAIVKLANMKSRSRRYVALESSDIHLDSLHLPTRKTNSGLFVSENVGMTDFIRNTKALCEAAQISFGKDVVFQKM